MATIFKTNGNENDQHKIRGAENHDYCAQTRCQSCVDGEDKVSA